MRTHNRHLAAVRPAVDHVAVADLIKDRHFANITKGEADVHNRDGMMIGSVSKNPPAMGILVDRWSAFDINNNCIGDGFINRRAAGWAVTMHWASMGSATAEPNRRPHQDASELVGRMKSDGLITQRKDGQLLLRSYGRDALAALSTIAAHQLQQEG